MGAAIKLKLFSGIRLLLKVFHFEAFVNRIMGKSFTNKSTSRCDFWREMFYRLLSAIDINVDFIVNSIDFQYNKTFVQSSGIAIYFYRQLIATLIHVYRISRIYGKHYIWRMKTKTELAKDKIGGQPIC